MAKWKRGKLVSMSHKFNKFKRFYFEHSVEKKILWRLKFSLLMLKVTPSNAVIYSLLDWHIFCYLNGTRLAKVATKIHFGILFRHNQIEQDTFKCSDLISNFLTLFSWPSVLFAHETEVMDTHVIGVCCKWTGRERVCLPYHDQLEQVTQWLLCIIIEHISPKCSFALSRM